MRTFSTSASFSKRLVGVYIAALPVTAVKIYAGEIDVDLGYA
jgi:hypothetical protein